jgi:hypothetical protein
VQRRGSARCLCSLDSRCRPGSGEETRRPRRAVLKGSSGECSSAGNLLVAEATANEPERVSEAERCSSAQGRCLAS